MVKKKGVKQKKVNPKRSLLQEAILDIDRELSRLSKEKGSLKRQISGIDMSVETARSLEKKLQERIAKLLEKEAALTEKKKKTQTKTDRLSDKLSKIQKIKSEMSDI